MSDLIRALQSLARRHGRDGVRLLALYVLGQVVVTALFDLPWGVVKGGDTASYLEAAQRFPSTDARTLGSPLYVVTLWLGGQVGSALWFAVAVQTLVVFAAAYALLITCRRFGAGVWSWFAPTFFLTYPLIAQWWRYALTEAIYIALVVLAACALTSGHGKRQFAWVSIVAVGVLTMRPNGVLLAGPLLGWVAIRGLGRRRGLLVGGLTLMGIVVLFSTVDILGAIYGDDNTVGQRLVAGDVIWNDPSTRLDMPATQLDMTRTVNVVRYSAEHPVEVAHVAARRLAWELIQYRPWYSTSLNFAALAVVPALIALAMCGLARRSSRPLLVPMLVVTVPAALTICSTWAVYEGRFGWWILAPALLPATLALHSIAIRVGLATARTD